MFSAFSAIKLARKSESRLDRSMRRWDLVTRCAFWTSLSSLAFLVVLGLSVPPNEAPAILFWVLGSLAVLSAAVAAPAWTIYLKLVPLELLDSGDERTEALKLASRNKAAERWRDNALIRCRQLRGFDLVEMRRLAGPEPAPIRPVNGTPALKQVNRRGNLTKSGTTK